MQLRMKVDKSSCIKEFRNAELFIYNAYIGLKFI